MDLSLYLHIPFCSTKCSYCAFNTYIDLDSLIDDYVLALIRESEVVGSQCDMPVHTIFFGGGTPSQLSLHHWKQIMDALQTAFEVKPDAEITLESNPNDLNLPYLSGLRELGFNRISIGMQSATPRDLRLFQREHNLEQVLNAFKDARKAGFDNINLDLIYGNPDQTLDEWAETLEIAIDLQAENLSLYALELKHGTPLREWVEHDEVSRPDDDLCADMYDLADERLADSGYQQYEISNWCKPGYESRHNLQYWRNLPYVGLGAGAHGFAGGYRTIVKRHPAQYIESLQTIDDRIYKFPATPAISKTTRVDKETEISETVMMGLRMTREGIQRKVFEKRFGIDFYESQQKTIDRFVDYGLLYVDDEVVRLTSKGRFLSNAVLRELI